MIEGIGKKQFNLKIRHGTPVECYRSFMKKDDCIEQVAYKYIVVIRQLEKPPQVKLFYSCANKVHRNFLLYYLKKRAVKYPRIISVTEELVEDIVDSGHTLSYLYNSLKGRGPASLQACVLLKKKRKSLDVPIHYLGFEIPDVWVVGYGLDFADSYRTLPYIAELKSEVYQKED